MLDNMMESLKFFYQTKIVDYIQNLCNSPIRLMLTILDIGIVLFLIYTAFRLLKNTRVWQLLKGIFFLIIATFISEVLQLKILNYILSSIMTYGVFCLIVIFQPEIRRGLEQLGSNPISKFFGLDSEIENKSKENIYRIVIAAIELAKQKTGALIVIERDIKIKDIISTGIIMDSEISPQLLVNIFVPNTPLHDGAVIISDNKIAAASCMLPLADDQDIARELGTRHRAAIGISKESDAIAVIVSEETGKISIAKDGTLIADVKEDVLKKILLKNLIVENKITKAKNTRKSKKIKIDKKEEV